MIAKFRRVFLVLALAAQVLSVHGQSRRPVVDVSFVPDSVAIGDHFELHVTVEKDLMQLVDFPTFDGNLTEHIEILEEYGVDTVSNEGRRLKLSKKYKLTTFEEGEHLLDGFPVLYIDKNIVDTLRSRNSLTLRVGTFDIDTETMSVHDIKPPADAPLRFGEFGGYLGIALLLLAAIALVVWRIVTRRRNLTMLGRPKPVEPPHVTAVKALQILHNQKLWQNNKHKQYYTRLTDILREYLHGRYGIHAMEMTSEEICAAIGEYDIPEKNSAQLKDILSTADFVKFAKYVPEAEYNETAYQYAYNFVEDTKPSEIEETPGNPDENIMVK